MSFPVTLINNTAHIAGLFINVGILDGGCYATWNSVLQKFKQYHSMVE